MRVDPPDSSGDVGRLVRVGDVDLAVRDGGSGRPFVWAHGLLSSMAREDETRLFGWQGITDVARVIRYDARGHGGSSATGDPADYTWPALGVDMLGLLDAMGIDRAALGGASMGCATAICAALLAPERVDRLVLVIPPTAWATRRLQQGFYKAGAAALTVAGLRALVATMHLRRVPPMIAERDQRSRQRSFEYLLRSDRSTVATILRGAGRTDLPAPADLAALTMPTLILAWHNDPGHPIATARKLVEVLPDATLHTAIVGRDLQSWESTVRTFLST